MNYFLELKYVSIYEWVCIEGDFVVIGILDYVQDVLGDLVYVEILEVG